NETQSRGVFSRLINANASEIEYVFVDCVKSFGVARRIRWRFEDRLQPVAAWRNEHGEQVRRRTDIVANSCQIAAERIEIDADQAAVSAQRIVRPPLESPAEHDRGEFFLLRVDTLAVAV